jgi:DNA-binding LacI/PurR family transcriptional regulator
MRKVTISDVARRAGVSTGTVSAVLNDRSSVRADTRQRVVSAIKELGYHPSLSARQLATRSATVAGKAVCLVIKEADNPFYAPIILGAQEVAERAGYQFFVANSYGEFEKEGVLVRSFTHHMMTGAIIAPVMHDMGDRTHLYALKQLNFPFVVLERLPGLNASSVSIDNENAMQMAVSHLIELGHRRIVHISGPPHTYHTHERIHGVQRAYSQSPLIYSDDLIYEGGTSLDDGYRVGRALFEGVDPKMRPTGVACFNDLVAIGVLRALVQLGICVPDDVSVVGCDDIEAASFLSPPLTTVCGPREDIGRTAAELLLQEIENPDSSETRHVRLESRLIVRSTTKRVTESVAV